MPCVIVLMCNRVHPTFSYHLILLRVISGYVYYCSPKSIVAPGSVLSQRPGNRKAASKPTPKPAADDELTDECPEPNGYFADGFQCDKYYECIDGAITEKLCPDGMVFNDYNIQVEKCDLPFNIDCSSRPELRQYSYLIRLYHTFLSNRV